MTPILVRPVREQLEHDRIIRVLQAKFKRRYEVGINTGSDEPDVVLASDSGRKPVIVIEVETGESVNNLEAMAQWARFGRLKAAFHLYIPAGSIESARRLCQENDVKVAEIWSYHAVGDQIHFAMAYRAPVVTRPATKRKVRSRPRSTAAVKRKTARGRVAKGRSRKGNRVKVARAQKRK